MNQNKKKADDIDCSIDGSSSGEDLGLISSDDEVDTINEKKKNTRKDNEKEKKIDPRMAYHIRRRQREINSIFSPIEQLNAEHKACYEEMLKLIEEEFDYDDWMKLRECEEKQDIVSKALHEEPFKCGFDDDCEDAWLSSLEKEGPWELAFIMREFPNLSDEVCASLKVLADEARFLLIPNYVPGDGNANYRVLPGCYGCNAGYMKVPVEG